jgi:hypothetical protein
VITLKDLINPKEKEWIKKQKNIWKNFT